MSKRRRSWNEQVLSFWLKVDIRTPDECWPWKAYIKPDGYGRVNWREKKNRRKARNRQAHAIAYELSGKKIPNGHGVLHDCDNPPCCNPKHLFTGTQRTNCLDMYAKGRGLKAIGEDNGLAKLTVKQVKQIKRMIRKKIPQHVIGKKFNVGQGHISCIKRGVIWSHVDA